MLKLRPGTVQRLFKVLIIIMAICILYMHQKNNSLEYELNKSTLQLFQPENTIQEPLGNEASTVYYGAGHQLNDFRFKGLRDLGANGLLVEYEDMFPYEGRLEIIQSPDAYTKEEITHFLDEAAKLNLIVIPLIQSFGHMEFILKHEPFRYLREQDAYPNSLCPLHLESVNLVEDVVDQVLKMHPGAQWIHLGGDEVWNIKTCNRCTGSNHSADDLYLHHLSPILRHVSQSTRRRVMPILWDDMMRHWSIAQLNEIKGQAEIMVWVYSSPVQFFLPEDIWDRYLTVFKKIWIATAFKGATHIHANYVPVERYIDNHLSWLELIASFPSTVEVSGIAITGWSRYDHFSQLCELLPAGLPSLALCLATIKEGKLSRERIEGLSKKLGFTQTLQLLQADQLRTYLSGYGEFPGSLVYGLVIKLEDALTGHLLKAQHVYEGYTNIDQSRENRSILGLNNAFHTLDMAEKKLNLVLNQSELALSSIFHPRTVSEWIKTKIVYELNSVADLKRRIQSYLNGSAAT